ncbi:DUF882 domain-containing protein [Myxococcota bacterium]|nr:DUF882 domain-containing protein [Myxococcota bacterium]
MILLFLTALIVSAPKEGPRPKFKGVHRVHRQAQKVISLYNYHTQEILPLGNPSRTQVRYFFRCRVTALPAPLDMKLLKILAMSARHFGKQEITIISGYRSPRFNTELRKKLHQVAPRSLHTLGKAVDFTIPGIKPGEVARWLRRKKLGGVGFYKTSKFLHFDTGTVRSWKGI